jgi:hypothetical protein
MVTCQMTVSWFAREVMLFSPKARRCGALQALSDGDGLTRKPISDCCVCVLCIVTVIYSDTLGFSYCMRVYQDIAGMITFSSDSYT